MGGLPGTPATVRETTPPGRSGVRGSRLRDGGEFAVIVRVRDRTSVEDHEHVMRLDDSGRIVSLRA